MNVINTGIYTLYNDGNTLKTALYVSATYPGLYHYQAPQNAPFPYCVYGLVSGLAGPTFTENEENEWIQFSLYTEEPNAAPAGVLLAKLYSLFDYCTLTVAGYNFISMVREMPTLPDNDITQDKPIYGYVVQYSVRIQKNR